jgi:serine/threonine protein kinase/tetratricopeptide (TPR) repeat protein
MKCPNCGGEVSDRGGPCPTCSTLLPSSVLTGLLTPVPDDDETVFSDPRPSAPPPDPEGTIISADTTGLPASAGGVRQAPTKNATGPLKISQQFSARYIIVRLLGIGGMGAVYQAWDAELGVMVALKVIRPEVTKDPAAAHEIERRFKQELLLARQVTHKNVVRIHDLGEIDGIKYITMPYIEGEDLASVLKKSGALPVSSVVPIARQIAQGLQAAHEAGVVHRDLKPANIMLEKEHLQAIIMDFGIARTAAQQQAQASGEFKIGKLESTLEEAVTRAAATVAGAIVGTIEYMAPEQARGEAVDQRTDIYAFGLMLYDMLLGRRRAEQAGGAIPELQKRLAEAPPSPKTLKEEIPDPFDQLIARCIQPEAGKRFQSTSELVAGLDLLDDQGEFLPVKRVVGLPFVATVVVSLLALSGGVWWYTKSLAPPPPHERVSVVIADLKNDTGDAAFVGTLEPMLRLALQESSFITAIDRSEIRRSLGVAPPATLDESAARELAIQQGVGVVVSGALERSGSGFALSLKAAEAVTGNVIGTSQNSVGNKDQVLPLATRVANDVREALGGEPTDSSQRFAMEALSATSLDVVRHYAVAIQALADSKFEEAQNNLSEAVKLDPNFGLAWAGMGMMAWNQGQQQDAVRYVDEAVRHLDSMTLRERYRTRGISYLVKGDYQACVKEYGDLIARYTSDAAARTNRALCASYLRDMKGAVEEMKQVVEILPRRPFYRVNLALYAAQGGDFKTGEEASRKAIELGSSLGYLPLAFSQLGNGQVTEAAESYKQLEAGGGAGAPFVTPGLGDLAVYAGRFTDADRIFREGAARDLMEKRPDRAADKFIALANARLMHGGRTDAAVSAARSALANSKSVKIRFLAGRVFVEAGQANDAKTLMASLANEIQLEPQSYAKIIEGESLIKAGNPRQAIKVLNEAIAMLDTWLARLTLGRAYLGAGEFLRADSEFDRCLERRGEALSLFLDQEATYGYLPQVHYYQGLARQKLGTARFQESFRTYLAIREKADEDPLIKDIRQRIGG